MHNHNVGYRLSISEGFPDVRTRSRLSSSAVTKLTHLSPHCSTDTDTGIRKESPEDSSPQVFGETPLPWTTLWVSVVQLLPPSPSPSPPAAAAFAALIPFNNNPCDPLFLESARTC